MQITVPPELAAVADAFNCMTRTDSLTSLLNRGEFDSALTQRIHSLTEGAPGFALLLGDVDHFKRINDTRGHVEGDAVLRRVAGSPATQ